MKISVIIPVYNTEQYIEQCIESVLNIKGTENEIIIVNDGSTDRTPEILEKLTCPFSDVSETHWAYNDILLAACEY